MDLLKGSVNLAAFLCYTVGQKNETYMFFVVLKSDVDKFDDFGKSNSSLCTFRCRKIKYLLTEGTTKADYFVHTL